MDPFQGALPLLLSMTSATSHICMVPDPHFLEWWTPQSSQIINITNQSVPNQQPDDEEKKQ